MPAGSRPRPSVGLLILGVAVLAIVGCSGDDGDGASSPPPTTADPFAAVEAPTAGSGSAVIGVDRITFTVTSCATGAAPGDPAVARREFALVGSGRVGSTIFAVSVSRYRSDTGQGRATVTETARVATGTGDDQRGLEAKRTTAGKDGAWLDLTDPKADAPLITRAGGTVDIRANFAPEGGRLGDEAVTPGRLRARCP